MPLLLYHQKQFRDLKNRQIKNFNNDSYYFEINQEVESTL
jgi:hypothetical protein